MSDVEEMTDLEYTPQKRNTRKFIKSKKYEDINEENFYRIDITGINSAISNIDKFMTLHPEFFKTNISKKLIHFMDENIYSIYTEPLYFKDAIHDVNGFILTEFDEEEYKTSNKFNIILYLNKKNKNKECYIKQINDYIKHQMKYGNNVSLNYYKILSDNMITHCYYDEPVETWKQDVINVKKTFFSPHKKYLFPIMEDKFRSQGTGGNSSSWNNLILYGGPGSGKSNFVYRLSMMLKLSMLSVDMSLYMNKKKELYSLFHGQEFCLPNSSTKEKPINNSIIVLEEFDYVIDRLLDIENIFKYKDVLKKDYFNLKNEDFQERTKTAIEDQKRHDKSKNKETKLPSEEKKKKLPTVIPDMLENRGAYIEYVKQQMKNDNISTENAETTNSAQKNILKRRDYESDMAMVNGELNGMIKNIDEDNKSNVLRLSDLLELFQGPVPVKNRIIVATTNDFERIKDVLPALFRAGRMTPVPFNYLDWESLCELCKYYFDEIPSDDLRSELKSVKIPTSQIIETAIKYTLTNCSFGQFIHELVILNRNHK